MSYPDRNPKIYSIAPHTSFLTQLVKSILHGPLLGDWPRNNSFWLADVTIILPTQRGRLALSSAFASALGGGALLPDIRTLSGEAGEEKYFADADLNVELPKAIGAIERQLLLCKLIEKWVEKNEQTTSLNLEELQSHPARILSLAESLGTLIDELEEEQIKSDALRAVPDFMSDPARSGDDLYKNDLAHNFLNNLEFLEIVLSRWPEILQEFGLIGANTLRNLRVENQIQKLPHRFGDRPVIVAGSTGSVPSTAKLLKAITRLPRGCLVLPGLNTQMSESRFSDLLQSANAPHGNPQYGLSQLLRRLGHTPTEVIELAPAPKHRRGEIVQSALLLAKDTVNWNIARSAYGEKEIGEATCDIGIIGARNEREQSLAIALAARDSLARGESVGIITPDRNFARRIAIELKRFDILIDDSAGIPLFHSPAGRLVRQILATGLSNFAAVDLIALLGNGHVRFPENNVSISDVTNLLEYGLLRGQRPPPGISGLRKNLASNLSEELNHPTLSLSSEEGEQVIYLLDWIEQVFASLLQVLNQQNFSAAQLAKALVQVVCDLVSKGATENGELPGFIQFQNWAKELERVSHSGPKLKPKDAEAALQTLMRNVSIRTRGNSSANIFLWGRLEARMQSADLIIICTLNEGIWPEIADPGPWLSRGMRLNGGLEPTERHQGLAAHDFEMAIGQKKILLCYTKRIGATPALPSRLLERFCAFVGPKHTEAMGENGRKWLEIGANMDRSETFAPAKRPAPYPKASLRPRSISITEVETLIRSPFDLYAKYVLGLKPISPLGEDFDYRERGTLVHEVFAQFIETGNDPMDPEAHNTLMGISRRVFERSEGRTDTSDIWLKRLEKSALGFLQFERQRNKHIARRFAEKKMSWTFGEADLEFTLRGKADRIDLRHGGGLEIIDFKTGTIPSDKDMRNFMAPQLLVEAAIAKAAGFEGHGPAVTHALFYIKIGADPAAFSPKKFALPSGQNIEETADKFIGNLSSRIYEFLLSDHLPMVPRLMPNSMQRFTGSYDHLARTAEWTEFEGEGDE